MPMTTVYAARDSQGRDVVIKIVSGRTPTNELRVLQALNTPKARADPRNHTIHVLDFIYFDGVAFVVMPRWPAAFNPDFGMVKEMLHLMDVILETFDYLHENRIAHCDFLPQNLGINVINDRRCDFMLGMRYSSVVRYALYDFGFSLMYPHDTILEDVRDDREYNFSLRHLEAPSDPTVNPFQVDMAYNWCYHGEIPQSK
ncbi:hypothetical protein B0H34DRAFT_733314 [Crassisporium funariophilum]|nr:hypothetical protein B0H34DRAFT_733314 [Crassisporium funariophilum]